MTDSNAARPSLHDIFHFYRNFKKTDVFLPLSNQQCPALPAHRLTVLCSVPALAAIAYPSPSAALQQASSAKQRLPRSALLPDTKTSPDRDIRKSKRLANGASS